MNHCPVYVRLGSHAYGTVYTGPIGSILEPQLQGLDAVGELADASSLCGACLDVCPVEVPIPRLLNRLRAEGVRADAGSRVRGRGSRRDLRHALIWRIWAWLHANPLRYRVMTGMLSKMGSLLPRLMTPWTRSRAAPRLATKSLHRLARQEGFSDDPRNGS